MAGRSYAYYPGCSMHGSAREYGVSTELVMDRLGIELRELEDWTCCGASSGHATSALLGYALPARNLRIAEEMALPVTTPCPACFARLKTTARDLAADAGLRASVAEAVGNPTDGNLEVLPILGTLSPEEVASAVARPLRDLKVACYYGCLFVRPGKVTEFDDEENPQSMDRLLEAAGADPVDWAFKTECCGASMAIARPADVERLSGRIIATAKRTGADCVAVSCAMCQSNLDGRQTSSGPGLPVLYFTQLLGLSMGFSEKEMMLERHFVDPRPMLREKGLL